MKPIIGLTTFRERKPQKTYSAVSYNYVHSIILAGGIPVIIPINGQEDDLNNYIDMIDGILFTGGEDVSPLCYGENPIRQVTLISSERDEQEISLFNRAYEKKLPILGICRGNQLINVALGGSLYQDINEQIKDALGHCPDYCDVDELYHSVKIEKESKLFEAFELEELNVNSFHHQSIKQLGRHLKATAFSSDNIIEGIESSEKGYLVGVQWHPEDLTIRYPIFLKLFTSFVNACRENRKADF